MMRPMSQMITWIGDGTGRGVWTSSGSLVAEPSAKPSLLAVTMTESSCPASLARTV